MTITIDHPDEGRIDSRIQELTAEAALLASQYMELQQKVADTPAFFRVLGRSLGFGAAGKLDWARFKLSVKQEELRDIQLAYRSLVEAEDMAEGQAAAMRSRTGAPNSLPRRAEQ